MNLYKQWLKEYKNKDTLDSEHGFIIYSKLNNEVIYLEDMFIKPESRNQKHSLDLANKLVTLAKEQGFVQLITSLDPKTPMFERSYNNAINFGFKISHVHGSLIILKKDII